MVSITQFSDKSSAAVQGGPPGGPDGRRQGHHPGPAGGSRRPGGRGRGDRQPVPRQRHRLRAPDGRWHADQGARSPAAGSPPRPRWSCSSTTARPARPRSSPAPCRTPGGPRSWACVPSARAPCSTPSCCPTARPCAWPSRSGSRRWAVTSSPTASRPDVKVDLPAARRIVTPDALADLTAAQVAVVGRCPAPGRARPAPGGDPVTDRPGRPGDDPSPYATYPPEPMPVAPVTLEGRHVILEPMRPEHAAPLAAACADPAMWTWMPLDGSTEAGMTALVAGRRRGGRAGHRAAVQHRRAGHRSPRGRQPLSQHRPPQSPPGDRLHVRGAAVAAQRGQLRGQAADARARLRRPAGQPGRAQDRRPERPVAHGHPGHRRDGSRASSATT